MSDKTITITLSIGEARRILNSLLAFLMAMGDKKDFPELEPAQKIVGEWITAKYKGQEEMVRKVGEAIWWLSRSLIEKIEKTGEPLLGDDEISEKNALKVVRKNRKKP